MREKRDFNFALRWEQLQAHANGVHRVRQKRRRVTWVIGGVLVITLVGTWPWIWTLKIQHDMNTVDQKVSALQDVDQLVRKNENLRVQIQSQQQLLTLLQNNSIDPGPILEKMRVLLPAGTTINAFSLQADKTVKMSIISPTPVDVARLWVSFRESGLFEGVDIQTVSLEDKIQTMNLNLKLK